jgi:hypothetical protein
MVTKKKGDLMFNKQIVSEALKLEVINVRLMKDYVLVEYSHKNGNGFKSMTQSQLTEKMRKHV